jgi:hypothetical protein
MRVTHQKLVWLEQCACQANQLTLPDRKVGSVLCDNSVETLCVCVCVCVGVWGGSETG